jgi:hypothetical protein
LRIVRIVRHVAAGAGALAVLVLMALPAAAQVAVRVDGSSLDLQPPPIIQAGRVFVPLRGIFERLGASVVYDNGTINATGNGRTISLQIGSTQASINGQTQTLDVAPFIVGASTFVPLRFVSEALGASVDWDDANQVVSISTAGAGPTQTEPGALPASDDQYDYSDSPPPPIPVYEQPYVPAPDYVWQPGYWGFGPYGFYWVPGTWVQAPQPGYLWTPGYWGYANARYGWHRGYWATAVGFYGGVNYGCGYYGSGYVGGRWDGNHFRYNTYVTRVNITIVRNVYVDRSVYVNNSPTRISYNGGRGGLQARPNAQQLVVARAPHLGLTVVQQQHIQTAGQDRSLLARFNHNRPPVLTVARPLSSSTRPAGFVPVTPSDRVNVPRPVGPPLRGPTPRPAPTFRARPVSTARPTRPISTYHPLPGEPVVPIRPIPTYHALPIHTGAPRPPVEPTAPRRVFPTDRPVPLRTVPPARVLPVQPVRPIRTVPPYHPAPAPPVRVEPTYRALPIRTAPPVRVAPVYHAPTRPVGPAAIPHPHVVHPHPPPRRTPPPPAPK